MVLALVEGCAAFRAGVARTTTTSSWSAYRRGRRPPRAARAEAEGNVLEIDDDVEFLGTRWVEQRRPAAPPREPPRRKSPPPRDTIRTFGGSTARPTEPVRLRVVRRNFKRAPPGSVPATGAYY